LRGHQINNQLRARRDIQRLEEMSHVREVKLACLFVRDEQEFFLHRF
jgi:hypothetical protein